ncbi:MAG: hypothetical protein APF76_07710 [Desulfitibacter sp. BRH_c19]|nr:MAG: hypothetical protein APF76_07710 [Desulfitibacter sp. BRH_c19]
MKNNRIAKVTILAVVLIITLLLTYSMVLAEGRTETPIPDNFPNNHVPALNDCNEMKIDPPKDGRYLLDENPSVYVSVYFHSSGTLVDWVSDINISHVFVKGGKEGGTLYSYDPAIKSDTNLGLGTNQEISHLVFYWCTKQEHDKGSITVNKLITDGTTDDESAVFIVKVTGGPDNYYSQTKNFGLNSPALFSNLEPGNYVVEEINLPTGYKTNKATFNVTIPDGTTDESMHKEVTITNYMENDPEKGSITVNKVISGGTDQEASIDFSVKVTGGPDNMYSQIKLVSVNSSAVFSNLDPGAYLVEEINLPTGYKTNKATFNVTIPDGTTDESMHKEVTITNYKESDPEKGSITVNKVISGGTDQEASIDFSVKVTGGPDNMYSQIKLVSVNSSAVFSNLDPGAYLVEEINLPTGYKTNKATFNVTIPDGTTDESMHKEVTITNYKESDPEKAMLVIKKHVINGNTTDKAKKFDVEVTYPTMGDGVVKRVIQVSENVPVTLKDLDFGTYTFKELNVPSPYKFDSISTSSVVLSVYEKTDEVLVKNKKESDPPPNGSKKPRIDVKKYVSVDGKDTWDDANSASGPETTENSDVFFKFVVTNTGDVRLTNITLTDDYFDDLDEDEIEDSLSKGSSFEYIFGPVGAANGQHKNTATATGDYSGRTYTDTDPAHYIVKQGDKVDPPPPNVRPDDPKIPDPVVVDEVEEPELPKTGASGMLLFGGMVLAGGGLLLRRYGKRLT